MNIAIVTTCTNRKRSSLTLALEACHLPEGTQDELLTSWTDSVKNTSQVVPANALYCGRGFSEILTASANVGADLFIISAGLGFISSNEKVPNYNLTASKNTKNSIEDRCHGGFSLASWWYNINRILHGDGYRLASEITGNSKDLFVIALSATYTSLIHNDLVALAESKANNIRIIGLSKPALLPNSLRRFWMPYDERFDGEDSPNPGTRSDFPQRAARHFIETIVFKSPNASPEDHYYSVVNFLNNAPPPRKIKRPSVCDDEIARIINARWDDAMGNSSRMLRIIRDEELIACEQSRFASIFREVKKRMS